MKICLDGRFWGPTHTGLGIYTRELVYELARIDSRNEYFLLLRREMMSEVNLPANFHKVEAEAVAYSLKEQWLLPYLLYKLRPDLVHFPSINVPLFYLGRYVVTIHDLIKHESRGRATTTRQPLVYWLKYLVYRFLFRWVLFFSGKIIVPSESVKAELFRRYRLNPGKIRVTYEAPVIRPEDHGDLGNLVLPDNFAIYTGNAYPHKNLENLIIAWKEVYRASGVKLIFSSARSVFTRRFTQLIKEHNAGEYLLFLGYLSEAQLVAAYRRARIYVFPSFIEGFGIPGLDAMNSGLPVVCSDIPVLREVYGEAAYYFNPGDRQDISGKVIRVLRDVDLQKKLAARGRERVKRYSWQKMARQTLEIYEDSVGLRSG